VCDVSEKGGTLVTLGERLVKALPPTFLALILLNICFLGVTAWVFQHNTEIRNQMIQRIIESCLSDQNKGK
jgi:hypothetical protein